MDSRTRDFVNQAVSVLLCIASAKQPSRSWLVIVLCNVHNNIRVLKIRLSHNIVLPYVLISTACAEPLGLENGHMHKDYLSGSSNKNRCYSIRLNNNQPWYSEQLDPREYFQVVITPYGKTVTALAFQGYTHFVTSFTLKTSEDGTEWHDYTVHGNIEVKWFIVNWKILHSNYLPLLKVAFYVNSEKELVNCAKCFFWFQSKNDSQDCRIEPLWS